MKITLVRHGKSMWLENKPMLYKEFRNWVEQYDHNGVLQADFFPLETIEKIAAAHVVLTSTLKRSRHSAAFLNPAVKPMSDSLFRETELPVPLKSVFRLKLNPSIWAVVFRCLWFAGYSDRCESLADAKTRASEAAAILIRYSEQHGSIVLVGHGFFNMLIAKELLKRGWKGKRKPSSKHWHSTTYSF
ncbi:histidine phosphatase family protein [Peribacillus deserti]|uniref:Histidine phosphatase family protein n=1 Tax=Peribacillus deserti TaxID=673318 RepID=A0A2N5M1M3_9BACI|nr:phosphoglycerate mutase family protein [Peribacillus deserti]PLT28249.1 histidine phosphatase family protein [Peribacillus deserti]